MLPSGVGYLVPVDTTDTSSVRRLIGLEMVVLYKSVHPYAHPEVSRVRVCDSPGDYTSYVRTGDSDLTFGGSIHLPESRFGGNVSMRNISQLGWRLLSSVLDHNLFFVGEGLRIVDEWVGRQGGVDGKETIRLFWVRSLFKR